MGLWDCGMASEKHKNISTLQVGFLAQDKLVGVWGGLKQKTPRFFSSCGFMGLWDGLRKIHEIFQHY